jgi:flavin-dependent dehydrogenase/AcrR family transcriptional regulator
MPKETKNRETTQKILDAALALWSEKGYTQSTMRELAQRVGMGVSSLYFYFGSKEEIVQYHYQVLNQQTREAFRKDDRGETDLGRNLERYLQTKLAILEPHRSSMAAILREAVDPESALSPFGPASAGVLRENLELFAEWVERSGLVRGEDAQALARALWLAHLGLLVFWLHDRTSGSALTQRLLGRLAGLRRILRVLLLVPGSRELLRTIGGVGQAPEAAPAQAPVVAVGDTPVHRQYDVAVIGGGPVGALYASFVKQMRPRTRVAILERSTEPGHKIGESTLSGFCKAVRSIGVRQEPLDRLFYPKHGLAFLHVDETLRRLTDAPEYVLETFDTTYQVERRVLDTLLLAQAQRLGVDVLQGATVSAERSRLGAAGNQVVYAVGGATYAIGASLVVDATGPAGVLSHRLGLRTSEGLPFQTGAVWTYYSGLTPLAARRWPQEAQAPRDQYTMHLCFREGWLWHIPLVSWQGAPTANLGRAIERLLGPARGLPSRDELARDLGCPHRDVVSIGIVVRSDRDGALKDDPRAGFAHYVKKYRGLAELLEGGRPLEDYYGPGQTFMSRLNFRSHARRVSGDGWLLVGDAAFFVDPLISPGLTGGTATAYRAAMASVAALDAGIFGEAFFSDYESFVHGLHDALERDNQLVYMSFDHPEALALVQRLQEIAARRHFLDHRNHDYGPDDTNVWGILAPEYQQMQRAAWSLLREEEERLGRSLAVSEQSSRDYEPVVARLRALLDAHVGAHEALTPYVRANRLRPGLRG